MENTEQKPEPAREIVYLPAYPGMGQPDDDEIDLFQLWQVLWQARKFIVGFTLGCTLLAVFVTLFVLPVVYKADMVLMPTESQGSTSALAGLAATLPIPITIPGGGKSESITAFLESRTLKERLLSKYDLLPRMYPDLWDAEKKKWRVGPEEQPSIVKVLQSDDVLYQVSQDRKSNLITVSWEDEDPAFAALMLERIIAELQDYLDNEYESDSKREREFVEAQLAKVTRELNYWERRVPSQNLSLSTIQRELLATQAVYAELRKQLELAKISEAKDVVRFKVLDPPLVPEVRFKPKRTMICALTIVASGMLAIFLVFGRHAVLNRQQAQAKEGGESKCAASKA